MVVTSPGNANVAQFVNGYSYKRSASLSVRADPASGSGVKSVQFKLDGATIRTESVVPYCVAADNNGAPYPWRPPAGKHVLRATPYSQSGGSGIAGPAINVSFTAY